MNLGEFRRKTKDLPDDTDLLGDAGDMEACELDSSLYLPPTLEHPPAVLVRLGQAVTIMLDVDARLDAARRWYY